MMIDQFYKKIFSIIQRSYKPQSDTFEHKKTDNEAYTNLRSAQNVWKDDNHKWPEIPQGDSRNPPQAYKDAIVAEIQKTLTALRNFIQQSDIFSKEDKAIKDGIYQKLMIVLDEPTSLIAIERNEPNKKGIYIRDLVHNHMYWELPGSHIQLMRNVADVCERIMDISLDKKALDSKKADIQHILISLFPHDTLSRYRVCPGGHTNEISNAKVLLPKSPEDVLLNYWNKFKSTLITKDIPDTVSIYHSISENNQVHIPPTIDHYAGVSKDLINQKDRYMYLVLSALNKEQRMFVSDHVFKFP